MLKAAKYPKILQLVDVLHVEAEFIVMVILLLLKTVRSIEIPLMAVNLVKAVVFLLRAILS